MDYKLFLTLFCILESYYVVCGCHLCHRNLKRFAIRLNLDNNIHLKSGFRFHNTYENGRQYLMVNQEPEKKLENLMIDSIKWYKKSLSPIMPPNCRFLPTCSSYGIQAIEEFGPWKGGILIAWRILRCNPFGGAGYDPPRWPPPGYFAGTYRR